MTINVTNAITDLRKSKGYSVEQLSVVSGLTEQEISTRESGALVDPAKLARLLAAGGVKSA